MLEQVADAPVVEVEGGGAAARRLRDPARGDAVRAVREIQAPRGVQDRGAGVSPGGSARRLRGEHCKPLTAGAAGPPTPTPPPAGGARLWAAVPRAAAPEPTPARAGPPPPRLLHPPS